jgi:hypothetical protein
MPIDRCLFCGGDASHPYHLLRCDGRQGKVEALLEEPYQAPYAAGSETSQAAATSIEPTAESLCGVIYAALKRTPGGLTCSEVETRFELRHQTASARLWDLHTRGHIVDSGQRRPSLSGRASIVWVPRQDVA